MRSLFLLMLCSAMMNSVKATDTIFIRKSFYADTSRTLEGKDTVWYYYNAIYIDSFYALKKDNLLLDFSFHEFDTATFLRELSVLPARKHFIIPEQLPRNWVPLYFYYGNWYTYVPCDGWNRYYFRITDSLTIDGTGEGPEPGVIKKVTRLSANRYEIIRKTYWTGSRLLIDIINPEKGIALMHSRYNQGKPVVMVSAEKAANFPTIINYSCCEKVFELDFQEVDKSLIRKMFTATKK
jgi:hypothetical protein